MRELFSSLPIAPFVYGTVIGWVLGHKLTLFLPVIGCLSWGKSCWLHPLLPQLLPTPFGQILDQNRFKISKYFEIESFLNHFSAGIDRPRRRPPLLPSHRIQERISVLYAEMDKRNFIMEWVAHSLYRTKTTWKYVILKIRKNVGIGPDLCRKGDATWSSFLMRSKGSFFPLFALEIAVVLNSADLLITISPYEL